MKSNRVISLAAKLCPMQKSLLFHRIIHCNTVSLHTVPFLVASIRSVRVCIDAIHMYFCLKRRILTNERLYIRATAFKIASSNATMHRAEKRGSVRKLFRVPSVNARIVHVRSRDRHLRELDFNCAVINCLSFQRFRPEARNFVFPLFFACSDGNRWSSARRFAIYPPPPPMKLVDPD